MSVPAHSESFYGDAVQLQLEAQAWGFKPSARYNIAHGFLLEDLAAFLEATQPGHYWALTEGGDDKFASDVRNALSKVGTAHALKHGLRLGDRKLRLCGFKPQYQATLTAGQSDYPHNRFTVIRELTFNADGLRLDFGFFLNGLPLFTVELKSELSEQTVTDAMEQYREWRLPEFGILLKPVEGAIAHFAVSQDGVAFTTRLQGADTEFLPFNPGIPYEKPAEHAYVTDYLWQQVFQPDSVLDLLEYFVFQKPGSKGIDVLFPRFHQWECVQQLKAAVLAEGVGHRYLQQHSAGSGKSNTISWLAYQLAYLTSAGENTVFDKVLVVTDRIALDRQLGGVLNFMQEATIGQMANCARTKDLLRELQGKTRIIVTTIQKFTWLQRVLAGEVGTDSATFSKIKQLKFAVLIDEAHSSQGGDFFSAMVRQLTSHTYAGRNIPNVSFFAFTATPRDETLELFGRKNRLGDLEPFHSYSMQQAIDEGYILDVRKGYHQVEVVYVVESTEEGRKVEKPKDVFRHIFEDPEVAKAKARETLRLFAGGIEPLLAGQAQAMVVCNSRKAAGLFKLALDILLAEQAKPYKALGAFTDKIQIDGRVYDEFSINQVRQGLDLGKLFLENPDQYKFLVVADKFQVGFDCPRLVALFVDKGLEGLAAVQTLSRLNRSFPHKDSTLVVDFVNDRGTIMKAFDRYIEPVETVPRDVLPRLTELHSLLLKPAAFTDADVAEHWTVFRKSPEGLYALMRPIKTRVTGLAEAVRKTLLANLLEFKELYSLGVKLYPDALRFQELAAFVTTLVRYIDKKEAQKSARLPLKVVLASVVQRDPDTPEGCEGESDTVGVPGDSPGSSASGAKSPAEKELAALLLDLSRRSLEDLADPIHELIEGLVADSKVSSEARRNPFEVFAHEGQTQHRLDNWVTSQIFLLPSEQGEKLRKALLGKTKESADVRNNILRVVFLRANSTPTIPK